jgi:hypothetical protein
MTRIQGISGGGGGSAGPITVSQLPNIPADKCPELVQLIRQSNPEIQVLTDIDDTSLISVVKSGSNYILGASTITGSILSTAISPNTAILSFYKQFRVSVSNGTSSSTYPIQAEIYSNVGNYLVPLNGTTKFTIPPANPIIALKRDALDIITASSNTQTTWIMNVAGGMAALPDHGSILAQEVGVASILAIELSLDGTFNVNTTTVLSEGLGKDYTVDYSIRTATKIILASGIGIVNGTSKIRLTWIADIINVNNVANFLTYTKVDPNNKITITSKTITVTGETNGASNVYTTITSTGDFSYDIDAYVSADGFPSATHIMLADSHTGNPSSNTWGSNNGVGVNMGGGNPSTYFSFFPTHCVAGSISNGTGVVCAFNTQYYLRFLRVGTTLTLNVFTDAARTTHQTGSPQTLTVVNTPFSELNVALTDVAYAASRTYNIQNLTIGIDNNIPKLKLYLNRVSNAETSPDIEPIFLEAGKYVELLYGT